MYSESASVILSNIFGWVSIACWIVVYSPQIWENYVLQSGEGVSVAFIVIWLVGDLTNFLGAIITHLIPTISILAVYFSLCDIILLLQIYYYRRKRRQIEQSPERAALLSQNSPKAETVESAFVIFIRYFLCLLFVFGTGAIAWVISEAVTDHDTPAPPPPQLSHWVAFTGQVLGWTSAFLFLGARIPQIWKNISTKCSGLSPALFFFSILGNLTYAASILAKSTDTKYLIRNSGWLAGSLLTVFLDLIVICQFIYYRTRRTVGVTTSAIRTEASM